ncbi:hypothetical protein PT277_05765 [Acetobacteraceae bacterium ESL0709]|nr:hypothetical protein [Acetobacteraceae bacterium ESL0697]MDF7678204.1 hypothetical protein [Acetobacteraceae bacterium ESL0709]
MKRLTCLVAIFLLAGCSHETSWEDRDYAEDMDVAQTVFDNGRMAQAEFKYREAFKRAFLVNDPQAIHDAGFNLATSQVRQNHVKDALKTIDRTLSALENRQFAQRDDLHLIKAAALYRQKHYQASMREARWAQSSSDRATADEAVAFVGYNAAVLKDDATLSATIQTLSHADKMRNRANLLELQTLSDLAHHQWLQALGKAQTLVVYRRENDDYLAMRRALELQVQAYNGSGQWQDAQRVRQQIKDSVAQEKNGR